MKKEIIAYSDADWGNCSVTQRSVTGYLKTFHGCLFLWKTRKQQTVSLSTAKAEYKSLCNLTSGHLWLCQWCQEAGVSDFHNLITIFEDNQSCIKTATSEGNLKNKRMKHINIQLHFVREAIDAAHICLQYVLTLQMLAYFLTKLVPRPKLVGLLVLLGVLWLRVRGDVDYLVENQDKSIAKRKEVIITPATEQAHNKLHSKDSETYCDHSGHNE
ncbi:hypothetical protein O181_105188 [Austropuccinia psidii MF-1]|uniref:Copia protein n=1 Tax=Austropuccinia psidii MF-1 TaxID=1389203 RepID=A0A9Q3PKR3_9BASI|nr:hypothetical protein [Austropuccinia psidii MF-1]